MTTADKMVAEQQYYNCTKIHFSGKRSTIFPTSGIESKMTEELKGITSEKDWGSYCFKIEESLQPIQAAERNARIGKSWACVTILLIANGASIYLGVKQNDISYYSFLFSMAMYAGIGAVVLITICYWWICYNSNDYSDSSNKATPEDLEELITVVEEPNNSLPYGTKQILSNLSS